ncbi:hypothetical protein ACHAW6_005559 [Cyclotella cf. meneghiniana]
MVNRFGCEHSLGLFAYVSSLHRTRLDVRNYERLAMLASILNAVSINPEWVAKEIYIIAKREVGRMKATKRYYSAGTLSISWRQKRLVCQCQIKLILDALLSEDQDRAGGFRNRVVLDT